MARQWFVIQTKPKQEDDTVFHLQEKDAEVYLPKIEVMTYHARKKHLVRKPLFPCYLFARFDPKKSLAKIRWTRGVVRILLDSTRPVPLSDEVVVGIRGMEGADGMIRRPWQEYKRVRITRGPFKDMIGTVDRWLRDKERVRILLDLVSYQASIEVHPSLIEKAA